MKTVSTDKDVPSSPRFKFRVHPLVLLSALYAAGLVGFFEILRYPQLHGVLWDQGTTVVLLSCGSLVAAVLLMLINRIAPKTVFRINRLIIVLIVLSALAVLLFVLATIFSEYALTLEMYALFFASLSMPLAICVWVLAYQSLSYRDTLLNSSLTFILFAVLLLLSTKVFAEGSHLLCVGLLFAGSVAALPFRNTLTRGMGEASEESDSGKQGPNESDIKKHAASKGDLEKHAADEGVTPLRFFVSIPLTGLALYALTTGLVIRDGEETLSLLSIALACVVIMVALYLVATRFLHLPDRKLMFYLYGFGLPVIAGIALVIKMIPIDLFTATIFREFMECYFLILVLASWTYLVSYTRIKSPALTLIMCGATQLVISLSLLTGYLVSGLGYPIDMTFLGLITALFLLFAVITVGRNIILFATGPETAEELEKKPLDIEAACVSVSLEYKLSPRETEVLRELAYGHSSSYVAKVLFISNNTARTHMKNIYRKLEINSREDLLELIREKQSKPAPPGEKHIR